jgi:hypothetical protein
MDEFAELVKIFSALKKYNVKIMPKVDQEQHPDITGFYSKPRDTVYVGRVRDNQEALDMMLHEGQHAAQLQDLTPEQASSVGMRTNIQLKEKKETPLLERDALMAETAPNVHNNYWRMLPEDKREKYAQYLKEGRTREDYDYLLKRIDEYLDRNRDAKLKRKSDKQIAEWNRMKEKDNKRRTEEGLDLWKSQMNKSWEEFKNKQ